MSDNNEDVGINREAVEDGEEEKDREVHMEGKNDAEKIEEER